MTRRYDTDEQNNQQMASDNRLRLLEQIDSPWKLIRQGSKLGIDGVKHFFGLTFLFGVVNGLLFLAAIIKLFFSTVNTISIIGLLLVALVGVGAISYTIYRVNRYIILNTIQFIYQSLEPFFLKVCGKVIDKSAKLFENNTQLDNRALAQTIDFSKLVHEEFQKLPRLIRWGITFTLELVPFMDILIELKSDVREGHRDDAVQKLFEYVDEFIQNTVFAKNNNDWVWWGLPLNMAISIILMIMMIK
ncbi:MAG TPA: hypothetical protein DCS93_44675 [Microscillaceae bacterium]|nr:hypothetical protein [Microscillaceae bacterium]